MYSSKSIFFRINDVVATGPDDFFLTNWVYFHSRVLGQVETVLLQLHWSSVVHHSRRQVRTGVDGLFMANGIALSVDKRFGECVRMGIHK